MTGQDQIGLSPQELQDAMHVFAAGLYENAVALACSLTERFPENSFGWKLLGSAYGQLGQHSQAIKALQRAISIQPSDDELHSNLGVCFDELGHFDAAIESHRTSLEINRDRADTHFNLGLVLMRVGRLEEASLCYRMAVQINPVHRLARYHLGLTLLSLGQYVDGWPHYELRSAVKVRESTVSLPNLSSPQWRGESLDGKSLLLWPEQGFGDYTQFIRYASLLKARGVSHLTIRCPAPLRDLLATAAGVDEVITDADPVPPHDYWSFPLSLPLHFGTTVVTIPASLPYLRALPERLDRWRERLPVGGFKVGLVWKGNPKHHNDENRSLPTLATLAPLWNVPGISFVSLQKDAGEEEARSTGLPIIDLGSDIRDFADTAAIIDQLDLVICVDTAIAHVAGALGKPCWVMLPAIGCDWRWMRDRSDSPWYPGALRLFRQKQRGDWAGVIDEVVARLRTVV